MTDWQKRAEAAELRFLQFLEKLTNPPISIVNIDYQEQAEQAKNELSRFIPLFWGLYWKAK